MTLEPGRSLGHYRIVRLIGQGGMGAVYVAQDTTLGRQVALKVLPAEMAGSAERLARFQREAHAVAALNHPHIVTIHSVEHEGDTHFLTMELVQGTSLDHALPPGGLPLSRVFDVGIALADALAAAHEKGIVHRDLKPANVMITKDGWVKVLDFGLAKLAEDSAPGAADSTDATRESPLTGEGTLLGTVPYMSPEQVNGRAVDARTDIFSLGVVLYELATGRRPFGGSTQAETVSSILRDTPRALTESRQDAPRHLARIVDHCLQKDPEARFQTAKDVRNELRALRKEVESGASMTASLVSDAGAGGGRSRPWMWAAAGVLFALAVGGAVWMSSRAPASGPARAAAATDVPVISSVAVLPFADMSPDKDQEYFSDGMTEELLNALTKVPELNVAGRTSSFSFKGKHEDLRTIGEKLGVAHLLEGSVRKSGNRVRITAQLVKTADGFHLWSETYDRTLDDIFAVQDEIAASVAQALQVTLLGRASETKPSNAEAYDLVLQARYVLLTPTQEKLRRAQQMLERAQQLSPEYAPVWAEMGLLHMRRLEESTGTEEAKKALEAARTALGKALQLDPGLAVAHARLAGVQQRAWDFAAAERSIEKALAISPRNPAVLGNAAGLYGVLGRDAEAIRLAEQATRLEPLSAIGFSNLGNLYSVAGRLDDAEASLRRAIELRPEGAWTYSSLASCHLVRGRWEEARSALKTFLELAQLGDYGRLQEIALVEHTAGNAEASLKAVQEFERQFAAQDPLTSAVLRAWRGDLDEAFAWLDEAYAARDPYLGNVNQFILLRARLHEDPRWGVLLGKIGLPTP